MADHNHITFIQTSMCLGHNPVCSFHVMTRLCHNLTFRQHTSGSFVRPHKVNFGRSCSDAIIDQYESLQEDKLSSMQKEAVFRANRAQIKTFEFVGFDKILNKTSKHENLTIIDLRNQCIRNGDPTIAQICPNLVELDIRENLIATWDDVASITQHLPWLRTLNIGCNRLIHQKKSELLLPAFRHIEHLIAGCMEWSCNDLIIVGQFFPNLLSLQVPNNCLKSLDSVLCEYFSKLQLLDLDNNPIENWDEIIKLVSLKSLKVLYLKNTGVSNIYFNNNVVFSSLKILNLSDNKIFDWLSVSELEKLPALEELLLKNNTVLQTENFETNRQIVICRIQQLKVLDRIQITETEKRGAGLDYLKKYGTLYLKSRKENTENEFKKVHPCYERLVKMYGAPEESELIIGSTKLKNLLINITVMCPQNNSQIQKKFPRTMKIQKLRGMLQKLFRTSKNLILSYRSQCKTDIQYDFDNDLKDLGFYSIQDGDQIIVSW